MARTLLSLPIRLKMKAKVTVNKKRMDGVFKALKIMAADRVLVGIPQDKAERKNEPGAKINNAQIGYMNEFGDPARGIPARRHLQKGIGSKESEIQKILEHAASLAWEKGENINKGLEYAGLVAVGGVQKIIETQEGFDPLKPQTIKARERRKPTPLYGTSALQATGSYYQSITYVLSRKYKK